MNLMRTYQLTVICNLIVPLNSTGSFQKLHDDHKLEVFLISNPGDFAPEFSSICKAIV